VFIVNPCGDKSPIVLWALMLGPTDMRAWSTDAMRCREGHNNRVRSPGCRGQTPVSGPAANRGCILARLAALLSALTLVWLPNRRSDRLDRGHSGWVDRAVPLGPDTDIEALASVIVISAILGNQERLACRRARAQ